MKTKNIGLSQITQNQASKELIINENNIMIDSLIVCKAIDIINILPQNPQNGDVYLISNTPDASISTTGNNIAFFNENFGFKFIAPSENMLYFIINLQKYLLYKNNAWVEVSSNGSTISINDTITNSTTSTYSATKINAELNNKVDKILNKQLSTEDFTTLEKTKLLGIQFNATANDTDSNLKNRANHTGMQNSSTISDFQASVSANSDVVANTSARHMHSNKALLDTYTQTEVNIAEAVGKRHTHINQAILDGMQESFTTVQKTKLDGIQANAQVNIQADWTQVDNTQDDFIKNKPALFNGDYSNLINKPTIPQILDTATTALDKTWSIDKIKSYVITNTTVSSGGNITGDYKFSVQNANHGNWLLCNGSAVSRTTYSALRSLLSTSITGNITLGSATISGISSTSGIAIGFSIEGLGIPIGAKILNIINSTSITISINATLTGSVNATIYPFGNGDGSTTFNLPDAMGRVLGSIGQSSGLTNRIMGQSIGAETHTLTIDEMPSHSHTISIEFTTAGSTVTPGLGSGGARASNPSNSTGGGVAHNNMQPTLFGGNLFIYC